jgi:serine/threonine protein kinase/tetratricopeptide (TPR) repeat protein
MLAAGDRFDRYVIEELLGEGGMAQVYRAHDPRLHRRVALKVLRVNTSPEPDVAGDATARVMREARAAAALDHPNAISVFDVGETEGQLYIAMELVNGKSLRPFVRDSSIPWETKLRWMVDAGRALGAAHERGLVHRDVKPENIMVRSDGVVKVLDFGIAKRTRIDAAAPAGTGTLDEARTQSVAGAIVGTPWYLSPEQLRGEPVDGRADQFSWAVATYELLTGSLPWPKGVGGLQLVLAILNKTPDLPSTIVRALPSLVDASILKALAKSPSQRFEDMESLVSALDELLSPSRRSWAEGQFAATTKTDPAPAPTPSGPLPTTNGAATLPTRPEISQSLARPTAIAALAMACATVVGLVSARLVRPAPGDAVATTVAPSASIPNGPMPLTAAPLPRSDVPEAIAAYRAFRQSFRDADWNSAMRALETAVSRDPTMGAAYLRLAWLQSAETAREGLVHSSFHDAVKNRSTLDERDGALLEALEPYLQREPSDPAEAERRLAVLHDRWPGDAEIAFMLANVRYDRGDFPAAALAFDATTAIDPGFAQALSAKGGCLAYLGRFDEARGALDAALRASPTATEALWYQAEIAEQQGRCADQEAVARAWVARDPDDAFAYGWLANALAAERKPIDTVRTALEQRWMRLDPEQRSRREAIDRANLEIMTGDFVSAQAHLRDLEAWLASEPGAQAHAEAQALLMRIAQETGDDDKARDVAGAYLARKDAWAPPHRVDDMSIMLDPIPSMLAMLARNGGISATEMESRRTEWLHNWQVKTNGAYSSQLWVVAWALPAASRDQAAAALAALPSLGGPPIFLPTYPASAALGRVRLLAGDPAGAVEPLRRATTSCTVLGESIAFERAWRDLGVALQAQGDTAGACAAYAEVLSRWGHARPRSVTADEARAASRVLGCR